MAQEAEAGFTMPVTVSAGGMLTHRLQSAAPSATNRAAAFRAVLYPSVKLNEHWFGFAAVQVHSTPNFYEQLNSTERALNTDVLQAYLGYSRSFGTTSVTVKAGQMSSAFGSFLSRYDDADNPLIDLPTGYGYYYKPIGVYGLAGVEVDVASTRADARLQFANSSPGNPHNLLSPEQHPNLVAGGGYALTRGLRVGASFHRGPYLNRVNKWLLPGERPEDSPGTGAGVDVQWARGRLSTNGEWQRFYFDYPRVPAAIGSFGYAEAKVILTPRLYAAVRAGYQTYNLYNPSRQSYEVALGYRPNRLQLIKVGYLAVSGDRVRGTLQNVLGVQVVMSIPSLTKAWR